MSARARLHTAAFLGLAVVLVLALSSPGVAHVTTSWTHLRDKHVKPFTDGRYYTKAQLSGADAAINQSADPVHWTNLKGVPFSVDVDGNMDLPGSIDAPLAVFNQLELPGSLNGETATFQSLDAQTLNSQSVTATQNVTAGDTVSGASGVFQNLFASTNFSIPTFVSMGGPPSASGCDEVAESGSMKFNTLTSDLYICNGSTSTWAAFPNT